MDPNRQKDENNLFDQLDSKKNTLDKLIERMGDNSDFPLLSNTLIEVNGVIDNDLSTNNALTKSILNDSALTNKILKIVNAASYSQFGSEISTISRSIQLLGFNAIRNTAVSLVLLDSLKKDFSNQKIQEELIDSVFSGILATKIPLPPKTFRNNEELMISSILNNLGRLLTSYYLNDDLKKIEAQMEKGVIESEAVKSVLGVNYNELSIGVARHWNMPQHLITSIYPLPPEKEKLKDVGISKLLIHIANELIEIAKVADFRDKTNALNKLTVKYENVLDLSALDFKLALKESISDLKKRASIMNIDMTDNQTIRRLNLWLDTRSGDLKANQKNETDDNEEFERSQEEIEAISKSEAIMSSGILDMTNAMIGDYKINNVLQMGLEAMHTGMEFDNTIIFIKDIKSNEFVARYGFGKDSESKMSHYRFSSKPNMDVFFLATSGKDVLIDNASDDRVSSKIPHWHKKVSGAQSVLLLPIMVESQCFGMIYADKKLANSIKPSKKQRSLISTIKGQSSLAIKNKMISPSIENNKELDQKDTLRASRKI